MRGGNFLAVLILLFALLLLWLAYSGNYKATFAALLRRYSGGSSLLSATGSGTAR